MVLEAFWIGSYTCQRLESVVGVAQTPKAEVWR